MNDSRSLDDAFAELERRADHAPARDHAPVARSHTRPLLVAASAVTVVAVSGGVLLAAHHGGGTSHTQAGGPGTMTSTAPGSSVAASTSASAPATPPSTTSPVAPSTSPVAPSTSSGATGSIPGSPQDLEKHVRALLGDAATITVTTTASQPGDPYIEGVLTSSTGAKGGYDFQMLATDPGSVANCEDPDRSVCHVRTLSDGSSLAVGTEATSGTQDGGGTLYMVDLIRPDGTESLWHLSTRTDPKGAGPVLGDTPPFTTAQMTAILTAAR